MCHVCDTVAKRGCSNGLMWLREGKRGRGGGVGAKVNQFARIKIIKWFKNELIDTLVVYILWRS